MGILGNVILVTIVGSIIVLVRRLWGSKTYPQILTAFWVFFFCCALVPFPLLRTIGSYSVSTQPAPERLKGWEYEPKGYVVYLEELQADTTGMLEAYRREQVIQLVCVIIWLVGVTVSIIMKSIAARKIKKKIRESIQGEWTDWKKIGREEENSLKVYITKNIGPMTYGLKPAVYIPDNLLQTDIVKSILTHELTHIHRKHHLILVVMNIVSNFYWFVPYLEGVFLKCLREDMEFRCDYEVINNSDIVAKEYAKHYVLVNRQQSELGGVLSFGKEHFQKRLQLILECQKKPETTILSFVVLLLIVCGSCVSLANIFFLKDMNGFTKWDIKQAKQVVFEWAEALNEQEDTNVELYNLDYALDNLTYYYGHKYMEKNDLAINECVYLQGKVGGNIRSIELGDVYGFFVVRDKESGEWKLYDWGQ